MAKQRRKKINKTIQEKGEIKIQELKDMFPDVSGMTLRRDLNHLEQEGDIVRIWGGAKSIKHLTESKEDKYSSRKAENMDAKIKIARKAIDIIETGRSIFLDSGTTTMCLAEIMPDLDLSIITSGPNIGLEIINKNKPSVTIVGGHLNRTNISISGPNSLKFIENINIDIAFMGVSAFSLESGFTSGNYNEGQLKSNIIKKARKVIMLMDSSKIDKNMPFTFAKPEDIDVLICEQKIPDQFYKSVRNKGVKVF